MDIRFFKSSSGREVVKDFLMGLSPELRDEFYDAVVRLSLGEILSMPISRSLGAVYKGLHELRLRDRSGGYRVFYYILKNEAIYLLHGFKKKSQKTPIKELKLAVRRIKEI